jgi:hypothetical protein
MADKTITNFPTMGTSAAYAENLSGAPSGNTTFVPKKGSAGGAGDPATATVRPHVLERNGFKGAPQMTMSYPQAPEASQTGRNVRLVPSALGNRDFYLRRQQFGQNS